MNRIKMYLNGLGKVTRAIVLSLAVIFVSAGIAQAATTISTNILTNGTLGATGVSTFGGTASTTISVAGVLTAPSAIINGTLAALGASSFGATATSSFTSAGVLTLQNGETISNATDNVITLTAATTSLSGALRLTGTTAGYNALATIGTLVTETGADISANTGRLSGLQINLLSSGSTVTGFRGIDSRVTDTGTAANVVGLQAFAKKTAGISAAELWGTNSIAQLTGGAVLNAYGVVGDLTIGTGATITDVQLNSFATAGFFQSFIHTDAILAKAIDSAVTAVISSDTGRGKSAKGTFGVTSVLNGALSQSTEGASAAYKVMDFNTGANFDYGLDLFYSDSPYSNVFGTADIRLNFGDTIKNTAASSTTMSGDLTVTGAVAATIDTVASASAFAIDSNVVKPTGTTGIVTITGGVAGQTLTLIFTSAIAFTDDATEAANSINTAGAYTSADGDTLILIFDGTSWKEVSRSVNG